MSKGSLLARCCIVFFILYSPIVGAYPSGFQGNHCSGLVFLRKSRELSRPVRVREYVRINGRCPQMNHGIRLHLAALYFTRPIAASELFRAANKNELEEMRTSMLKAHSHFGVSNKSLTDLIDNQGKEAQDRRLNNLLLAENVMAIESVIFATRIVAREPFPELEAKLRRYQGLNALLYTASDVMEVATVLDDVFSDPKYRNVHGKVHKIGELVAQSLVDQQVNEKFKMWREALGAAMNLNPRPKPGASLNAVVGQARREATQALQSALKKNFSKHLELFGGELTAEEVAKGITSPEDVW